MFAARFGKSAPSPLAFAHPITNQPPDRSPPLSTAPDRKAIRLWRQMESEVRVTPLGVPTFGGVDGVPGVEDRCVEKRLKPSLLPPTPAIRSLSRTASQTTGQRFRADSRKRFPKVF